MKLCCHSGTSRQWYPFWWSVTCVDHQGELVAVLASGKAWSAKEAREASRAVRRVMLRLGPDNTLGTENHRDPSKHPRANHGDHT